MARVTVNRSVTVGDSSVFESASADLPDDIPLDDVTEARRRGLLAELLFLSLPSLKSKTEIAPCPPPPLYSLN